MPGGGSSGVQRWRGPTEPPPRFLNRTIHVSIMIHRSGNEHISALAGENVEADRITVGHHGKRPPQRAHVVLRETGTVPLVDTSIPTLVVRGEPEFGDEAGESREQGCVEQAFRPKHGMSPSPYTAQPESDDKNSRIDRYGVHDGFPVHSADGAVGEGHLSAQVPVRLVQATCRDQAAGAGDTSCEVHDGTRPVFGSDRSLGAIGRHLSTISESGVASLGSGAPNARSRVIVRGGEPLCHGT